MQNQLTQDLVPQEMHWLVELVGMEQFLRILDMVGGENIYFPKRETIERPLRHRAICREFNGDNLRQLSRKYGLTERCIRNILRAGCKRTAETSFLFPKDGV